MVVVIRSGSCQLSGSEDQPPLPSVKRLHQPHFVSSRWFNLRRLLVVKTLA
jgi:hypothetical protein